MIRLAVQQRIRNVQNSAWKWIFGGTSEVVLFCSFWYIRLVMVLGFSVLRVLQVLQGLQVPTCSSSCLCKMNRVGLYRCIANYVLRYKVYTVYLSLALSSSYLFLSFSSSF